MLWTITFALFVTSAVQVLRRREWHRPLFGFVGAAIVFQILTLAQPHVAIGALLVAMIAAVKWWRALWGIFHEHAKSSASPHARPV